MGLARGRLRHRIRIERPEADTSFDGAGSGAWVLVAEVWAHIEDALPSRAERLDDGINIAARPARVRMGYRSGITPNMRFVHRWATVDTTIDYSGARIMQIVSGPAELGNRDGLEFMVEDYSTAGNTA